MEKMICRILLFFCLTSCVMLQPRYTDPIYQSEENHNITAEWRFSSESNISVPSLMIHCVLVPGLKVFYHLDNSVEEPQDEQFSGRVQCDKDALRTGRVRLHVSRVRTEDSGLYLCRMATGSGMKVTQFSLNITAARDWPKTERPNTETPERPNTVRQGGVDILLVLILIPGLVAVLFALYLIACLFKKKLRAQPRGIGSHWLARYKTVHQDTSNTPAGNHSNNFEASQMNCSAFILSTESEDDPKSTSYKREITR